MTVASTAAWLGTAMVAPDVAVEVLLGMAMPLLVSGIMLVLIEQTYTRQPEASTALMAHAFSVKMLVFGAYVSVVVGLLPVRPVPFVVSFTAYFIATHAAGAAFLHALFASRMTAAAAAEATR